MPNPTATAKLYRVRAGWEWALIVLDEDTGLFACESSFGSFNHVWPPAHRSLPLDKFVTTLDLGYFLGKTRTGASQEVDIKATIARYREIALEERRQGNITKDKARDAWDEIHEIEAEGHISQDLFANQVAETDHLRDVLGDDWWGYFHHRLIPEGTHFWATIWPVFVTMIWTEGGTMEHPEASL